MSDERHVYFVEAGKGGPIKIGVAVDVAARIRDLQCANPTPLRLIVMVQGNHDTESRLHRRFAGERTGGEWFRRSGEVRAFAVSLVDMTPDERVAAVTTITTPVRKPKTRRPRRRIYTPEEWHALFCVGDSGSIYRTAEAEAVLIEADERRR